MQIKKIRVVDNRHTTAPEFKNHAHIIAGNVIHKAFTSPALRSDWIQDLDHGAGRFVYEESWRVFLADTFSGAIPHVTLDFGDMMEHSPLMNVDLEKTLLAISGADEPSLEKYERLFLEATEKALEGHVGSTAYSAHVYEYRRERGDGRGLSGQVLVVTMLGHIAANAPLSELAQRAWELNSAVFTEYSQTLKEFCKDKYSVSW